MPRQTTIQFQASQPLPLAVYVHLPWCLRKCPYCDFNSHAVPDALPEGHYIDALLADLQSELPRIWGRRIESVFIGGGTPSLFSPRALDRLLDGLRALLPLRPDTEITLEANPGTFEQERFSEFRAIGISRLSIGVQSFDDDLLERLGRVHNGTEARRAAEIAHRAGFDNFNLDLMFALPGQDRRLAQSDLHTALALEPTHLSYYQLTLEPNTLFAHAPPALPDEDEAWWIQEAGQGLLAARGYTQYEVSAYAKPGRRCRHNLNYWEFGDYLGLGAGAHGKLSDTATGRIERRWKQRQPERYMEQALGGDATAGTRDIDARERVFEFMLNALRLTDGFESRLFEARTGLPLAQAEPVLEQAMMRELIERDDDGIRPTTLGRRFLDELTGMFLPGT